MRNPESCPLTKYIWGDNVACSFSLSAVHLANGSRRKKQLKSKSYFCRASSMYLDQISSEVVRLEQPTMNAFGGPRLPREKKMQTISPEIVVPSRVIAHGVLYSGTSRCVRHLARFSPYAIDLRDSHCALLGRAPEHRRECHGLHWSSRSASGSEHFFERSPMDPKPRCRLCDDDVSLNSVQKKRLRAIFLDNPWEA